MSVLLWDCSTVERLELPTNGLEIRGSVQLSYTVIIEPFQAIKPFLHLGRSMEVAEVFAIANPSRSYFSPCPRSVP